MQTPIEKKTKLIVFFFADADTDADTDAEPDAGCVDVSDYVNATGPNRVLIGRPPLIHPLECVLPREIRSVRRPFPFVQNVSPLTPRRIISSTAAPNRLLSRRPTSGIAPMMWQASLGLNPLSPTYPPLS